MSCIKQKLQKYIVTFVPPTLFEKLTEKYIKKGNEGKHHGAVDKPSSENQFCKLDAITFVV